MGIPLRMKTLYENRMRTDNLSESAGAFAAAISSYKDVLWTVKTDPEEMHELQQVLAAWVVSHVVRARTRVVRHSAQLRAAKQQNTDSADVQRQNGKD